MKRFRLNRRALLRGAGSVAIALPWLEIMSSRESRAASPPARRFLAVFQPGGSVLEEWRPTGTESTFTLSPTLAPLAPVQEDIIVLSGVDMPSAVGEQNQSGMVALLTGTPQGSSGLYAKGPSIDQVLAGNPSRADTPIRSLELAVRWGTGSSHGVLHPINALNFADNAAFSPIKPRIDPVAIFEELFGSASSGSPAAWDRSILDVVDRRYARLAARLGAEDRARLDQHLTALRELERRIGSGVGCSPPELVDTSDYDPESGLNSADDGSIRDLATDAAIPKVGKLMIDMLVEAFACDLTSVATLQWSDSEAKHTFPWLGLDEHHHFYMNDGGYRPAELVTISTWYSTQHAYLIERMAAIDMGGHSLLDESVVLFGSNLQHPATHAKQDMPFLLAGRGGGLRSGRWLNYEGRSHNDLLTAILNLFGDTRTSFGDAAYSTGPLTNLT